MATQTHLPGAIATTILQTLVDGSCQTIDVLENETQFNRRQISDGASSLIYRGLLERVETGCYQLTAEGLEAAKTGIQIKSGPIKPDTAKSRKPWPDTLRQRAWNVMRMSATFTIGELVTAAAQKRDAKPTLNLQRYLASLKRVGYVLELAQRAPGTKLTSNGFKRYRLIQDTGPIAPIWRVRSGELFDHNLSDNGEVVACP